MDTRHPAIRAIAHLQAAQLLLEGIDDIDGVEMVETAAFGIVNRIGEESQIGQDARNIFTWCLVDQMAAADRRTK